MSQMIYHIDGTATKPDSASTATVEAYVEAHVIHSRYKRHRPLAVGGIFCTRSVHRTGDELRVKVKRAVGVKSTKVYKYKTCCKLGTLMDAEGMLATPSGHGYL